MPNALAQETSPYLLQHADNPVDWLPWGPEALARARDEDRPLLVSIGYSACHWCHVMAHESFEDPAVAAVMNERFVCVKVDREERPDVDAICMEAVQAMTGQGGWPLNVFLTPEQAPIHGGTYFPPGPRHGLPSWRMVLDAVDEAWRTRRDDIRRELQDVGRRLAGAANLTPADDVPGPGVVSAAVRTLRERYDAIQGGFGGAPKFPPHPALLFLLSRAADDGASAGAGDERSLAAAMARQTLRSMASGGIHDQLGGGFSRYAVDATWSVPHFEKMLYDNALLARAYTQGWLLWQDGGLRDVAERTLAFLATELRGPEGGFLAALDADSEGVEGKYYVWTPEELRSALDPAEAEAAIEWFGVTEEGNFERRNVLEDRGTAPDPVTRQRIRDGLLAVRSQRVRPGVDDKRLAGWNGLAIQAFAEAGAAFGRDDLLDVAREAAAFVRRELVVDGRLRRSWSHRGGAAGAAAPHLAVLEDHAYLLEALVALYEAGGDPAHLDWARELAATIEERFGDPERGGFFSTADDAEALLARRKEVDDAPIPAGGASAARGLLRLAALTGEHAHAEAAQGWLRLVAPLLERHPHAVAYALLTLDEHHRPPREVAIVGPDDEREALAAVVRERLRPGVVLAVGSGDDPDTTTVPLLLGRTPVDGRAAAYVCEGFACRAPVTDPEALRAALGR